MPARAHATACQSGGGLLARGGSMLPRLLVLWLAQTQQQYSPGLAHARDVTAPLLQAPPCNVVCPRACAPWCRGKRTACCRGAQQVRAIRRSACTGHPAASLVLQGRVLRGGRHQDKLDDLHGHEERDGDQVREQDPERQEQDSEIRRAPLVVACAARRPCAERAQGIAESLLSSSMALIRSEFQQRIVHIPTAIAEVEVLEPETTVPVMGAPMHSTRHTGAHTRERCGGRAPSWKSVSARW